MVVKFCLYAGEVGKYGSGDSEDKKGKSCVLVKFLSKQT